MNNAASGTGDLGSVGGAESSTGGPGLAGSAELSYGECMAELESILSELEADDPDVDLLAARVKRAATLIEICRQRITQAGLQVERVVAVLETGSK